jgi:hypothetical protein
MVDVARLTVSEEAELPTYKTRPDAVRGEVEES